MLNTEQQNNNEESFKEGVELFSLILIALIDNIDEKNEDNIKNNK